MPCARASRSLCATRVAVDRDHGPQAALRGQADAAHDLQVRPAPGRAHAYKETQIEALAQLAQCGCTQWYKLLRLHLTVCTLTLISKS